jgi:hypothetical protein
MGVDTKSLLLFHIYSHTKVSFKSRFISVNQILFQLGLVSFDFGINPTWHIHNFAFCDLVISKGHLLGCETVFCKVVHETPFYVLLNSKLTSHMRRT